MFDIPRTIETRIVNCTNTWQVMCVARGVTLAVDWQYWSGQGLSQVAHEGSRVEGCGGQMWQSLPLTFGKEKWRTSLGFSNPLECIDVLGNLYIPVKDRI